MPSIRSKLARCVHLLSLLSVVRSSALDKSGCESCVSSGCIYCRGEDFFDNPSACVCEGFDGFFGSCSDVTFGGSPYDDKWDCRFDNQGGKGILIAIVVVVCVVSIAAISACCFCRRGCFCKRSEGEHVVNSGAGLVEHTDVPSSSVPMPPPTAPHVKATVAETQPYVPTAAATPCVPADGAVPLASAPPPPSAPPLYAVAVAEPEYDVAGSCSSKKPPAAERMAELDRMKGALTEEEYYRKRAEILSDI